jgi:hypothetical protein
MKKIIQRLFHRHNWRRYKTLPEYGISWLAGSVNGEDGTAVFSKCKCGAKMKKWYMLKYKLVDGFLIHVL